MGLCWGCVEKDGSFYKVYTKNIIFCSTGFVHNIDITDCTENSGDANGKHGTSSNACERMLANDIKQNVFIQIFLGCEKDKKFCTAQVKGNNCKKITKEAARHTLTLKKGKRNIKIVQPANALITFIAQLPRIEVVLTKYKSRL